jgi:hypothetical protein
MSNNWWKSSLHTEYLQPTLLLSITLEQPVDVLETFTANTSSISTGCLYVIEGTMKWNYHFSAINLYVFRLFTYYLTLSFPPNIISSKANLWSCRGIVMCFSKPFSHFLRSKYFSRYFVLFKIKISMCPAELIQLSLSYQMLTSLILWSTLLCSLGLLDLMAWIESSTSLPLYHISCAKV